MKQCHLLETKAKGPFHEDFLELSAERCIDLLEVCCSTESILSKLVLEKGGSAFRATLQNACDLTTKSGIAKIKHLRLLHRPKHVYASPPCGLDSPMQRLNDPNGPAFHQRLRAHRKTKNILVKNVLEFGEEQIADGLDFTFEWSKWCSGWKHNQDLQAFLQSTEPSSTSRSTRAAKETSGIH